MRDYEILLWLQSVVPESDKQKRALESAERAFTNALNFTIDVGVEDFLSAYERDDLINKASGELYEEYVEYCNDFDVTEVTQNLLTRSVTHKYNLRVVVVYKDKKSIRVFK